MAQQLDPKTSAKQGGLTTIKTWMDEAIEQNAATIYSHGIDKGAFARLTCEALMSVEGLDQCDEKSFFAAVRKCFQDGLVPDGNDAVIYPRRRWKDGKDLRPTAVYLPMLHGIMRVIHRTTGAEITGGHILKSEESTVEIIDGTNPSITYRKSLDVAPDDRVIGSWALAKIPGKASVLRIFNRHDIDEAKKKSGSYDGQKDSPWGKEGSRGYEGFMAEKTAMKSLANRIQYLANIDPEGRNVIAQMLANDDEYRQELAAPVATATQIEDQRPAATIETQRPETPRKQETAKQVANARKGVYFRQGAQAQGKPQPIVPLVATHSDPAPVAATIIEPTPDPGQADLNLEDMNL